MSDPKRRPLGLTECVTVYDYSMKASVELLARIDTGATSNSLDVVAAAPLKLGPPVKKIFVRSANGRSERPVVYAKVKIAGKLVEGRFTLADRSRMKYKMLIGRDILSKAGFLIDPLKR